MATFAPTPLFAAAPTAKSAGPPTDLPGAVESVFGSGGGGFGGAASPTETVVKEQAASFARDLFVDWYKTRAAQAQSAKGNEIVPALPPAATQLDANGHPIGTAGPASAPPQVPAVNDLTEAFWKDP